VQNLRLVFLDHKAILAVSDEDRAHLEAIIGCRNRPLKYVKRARIVLLSAERLSVLQVARGAGISRPASTPASPRRMQLLRGACSAWPRPALLGEISGGEILARMPSRLARYRPSIAALVPVSEMSDDELDRALRINGLGGIHDRDPSPPTGTDGGAVPFPRGATRR
jgi:hypothetical protein